MLKNKPKKTVKTVKATAKPEILSIQPEGTPRTFRDAEGRVWNVALTLGAARRVDAGDYSELTDKKFSILDPKRDFFLEVLTDTPLLFAIIWAIVQPQVKANLGVDPKVEPEQAEALFVESLNGSAVKEGREAVWGSVADFFPEHRTALLELLQHYQKLHQRLGLELQGMKADIAEILDTELTKGMKNLKADLRGTLLKNMKTPGS